MTTQTICLILAFAFLQFISTIWIKSRLEQSLKYEYDKKLETFKKERELRQKASIVAEFLAEWTHERENTKRLNQLLWELTLYLPSAHVKKLKQCVQGSADITANELLISIRNNLLKDTDKIEGNDVTFFPDPKNKEMKFTS